MSPVNETDISDFITAVSDNTDSLEHHGVKGMRWGKRKAEGGDSKPRQSLHARTQEIKGARKRQGERAEQIKKLDDRNKNASTSAAKKAENAAEMRRLAKELSESPDRSASKKMTTGEHAVNLLLLGYVAPLTSGAVRGANNLGVRNAVKRAEKATLALEEDK